MSQHNKENTNNKFTFLKLDSIVQDQPQETLNQIQNLELDQDIILQIEEKSVSGNISEGGCGGGGRDGGEEDGIIIKSDSMINDHTSLITINNQFASVRILKLDDIVRLTANNGSIETTAVFETQSTINNNNNNKVLKKMFNASNQQDLQLKLHQQQQQELKAKTSIVPVKKTIFNYLIESENLRRQQQIEPNIIPTTSIVLQTESKEVVSKTKRVKNNNFRNRNINNNIQRKKNRSPNSDSVSQSRKRRTRSQINNNNNNNNNQVTVVELNDDNQTTETTSNDNNESSLIKNDQFSQNSLFHSSQSLLTRIDLKHLFQPSVFESLPRQSQLKLIKLLPECDRQLDSHGSFKLSIGALNNEFIKKCCQEWQHKLAQGDYGDVGSVNYDPANLFSNNTNSATVTRSTRLKQQKILENIKEQQQNNTEINTDDDEFFYYDEEDSLLGTQYNNTEDTKTEFLNLSNKEEEIQNNSIFESSLNETEEEDENDEEEEDEVSFSTSNEESDSTFSLDEDQEEEDEFDKSSTLKAKRLEIQHKARQLLKKNKKLRKKFNNLIQSEGEETKMSENEEEETKTEMALRKSQRKRKLAKKYSDFIDSMGSGSSDPVEMPKFVSSHLLEAEKKGDLKLCIKRVTSTPFVSSLTIQNSENETEVKRPRTRSRNNRNNNNSSCPSSPLVLSSSECDESETTATTPGILTRAKQIVIDNRTTPLIVSITNVLNSPSQPMSSASSTVSPNAPMTRSAAKLLKQQASPVIVNQNQKVLLPPPPLPPPASLLPPRNLFDDDEDEEPESTTLITKSKVMKVEKCSPRSSETTVASMIPKSFKTLAQIRNEIAEKRKKALELIEAEKKRKLKEEEEENSKLMNNNNNNSGDNNNNNNNNTNDYSYQSNIQKIVHELKLIGGNGGTKKDDNWIENEIKEKNIKLKQREDELTPSMVIKQQQEEEMKKLNSLNSTLLKNLDTSILHIGLHYLLCNGDKTDTDNDEELNDEDFCDILPSIGHLIKVNATPKKENPNSVGSNKINNFSDQVKSQLNQMIKSNASSSVNNISAFKNNSLIPFPSPTATSTNYQHQVSSNSQQFNVQNQQTQMIPPPVPQSPQQISPHHHQSLPLNRYPAMQGQSLMHSPIQQNPTLQSPPQQLYNSNFVTPPPRPPSSCHYPQPPHHSSSIDLSTSPSIHHQQQLQRHNSLPTNPQYPLSPISKRQQMSPQQQPMAPVSSTSTTSSYHQSYSNQSYSNSSQTQFQQSSMNYNQQSTSSYPSHFQQQQQPTQFNPPQQYSTPNQFQQSSPSNAIINPNTQINSSQFNNYQQKPQQYSANYPLQQNYNNMNTKQSYPMMNYQSPVQPQEVIMQPPPPPPAPASILNLLETKKDKEKSSTPKKRSSTGTRNKIVKETNRETTPTEEVSNYQTTTTINPSYTNVEIENEIIQNNSENEVDMKDETDVGSSSNNNNNNNNGPQQKVQRTTQHQLTVAQLLSQKHKQQKPEDNEIKPQIKTPTPPPVSTTKNPSPNLNRSPISFRPLNKMKSPSPIIVNETPTTSNNGMLQLNSLQTHIHNQQQQIQQSLMATGLNGEVEIDHNKELNKEEEDNAEELEKRKEKKNNDNEESPSHECFTNHKAMVECQKCGLLCHDDCIINKNEEESKRICFNCYKSLSTTNPIIIMNIQNNNTNIISSNFNENSQNSNSSGSSNCSGEIESINKTNNNNEYQKDEEMRMASSVSLSSTTSTSLDNEEEKSNHDQLHSMANDNSNANESQNQL